MASRLQHHDVYRRLCRARDRMRERHDEPISIAQAAREAALSPYHFLRLFRDAFQETPHRYLTRVRIDRAKERLARGASVTETCLEVGFSSLGSFSSLFAREVGCSPAAWQRSVRTLAQVPDGLTRLYVPFCFFAAFVGGDALSQFPRSELASAGGTQPATDGGSR